MSLFNSVKFKLSKRIRFTEILLIVFFLLIFFFVYLYFIRSQKWLIIDMKIEPEPTLLSEYRSVPHWLVNSVKQGDKEYNGLGQPVAEVIDIKTYETGSSYKEAYIKLKVNALYSKNQKRYTFSSKELYIGGPFSVKPNGILLEGVITGIEGVFDERKKVHKKVLAIFREGGTDYIRTDYITNGIRPWLAEAVKVGDEMKDFNGNTIAKILEKRVKPASRITVDAAGIPHLVSDPYLVDLSVVLDLETIYDKGIYYFRENQKVEINQTLLFHTEKYDFGFLITDILE